MPGKRHSLDEIASKLRISDSLADEGKLQAEIARQLGVSLMTYHRWRKARKNTHIEASNGESSIVPRDAVEQSLDGSTSSLARESGLSERMMELHLENSRLRRLVTDLLLETDRLEELLSDSPDTRARFAKAHKKNSLSGARRLETITNKLR